MDTQAMTELYDNISRVLLGLARIDAALEDCFGALRRLDRYYADALSSQLWDSGAAFVNEINNDIVGALPDAGRWSVRLGRFHGDQFRQLSRTTFGATHARIFPLNDEYEECGAPVDLALLTGADAFVAALASMHAQVTP